MVDIPDEVVKAEHRIRPYIRQTYLEPSPHLSQNTGANVFLKLENLQYTGSFKPRGAISKLTALPPEIHAEGFVAASTGNHGAAVAYGMGKLGLTGVIFVPDNASPGKVAAIERLGGTVRYHGLDSAVTEVYARNYARQQGMTYISPYNDLQVIAGQGTIALELCRQLEKIDALFVSLGGGGLVSGVAAYLKSVNPEAVVFGCSPVNSQVMAASVRAGKILDLPSKPTLSDGTAGGIEAGAITFELCRQLVDEYVLVTEDEIKEALRLVIDKHHLLVEGAAAVAVASFLKSHQPLVGKNVVIILCGGNISLETLKSILVP